MSRRLVRLSVALTLAVGTGVSPTLGAPPTPGASGPVPDANALLLAEGLPRCVDGVEIYYASPSPGPASHGPVLFDVMTTWVAVRDAATKVGADRANTWGSFGQAFFPDPESLSLLAWSDPTGDGARWLDPLTTTTLDDPYAPGEFDIERFSLGTMDVVGLSLPGVAQRLFLAATGPWVYYVGVGTEAFGQRFLRLLPQYGTDVVATDQAPCEAGTGPVPIASGDPFEALTRDDLAGGTYVVGYQACPGARIDWVPDATASASLTPSIEIVSELGPRIGQVVVDLPAGPGSFQGVQGCDISTVSWQLAPEPTG